MIEQQSARIKPEISTEDVARLARFFAWRFTKSFDDDALQAARIGLWLALKRWDPARGRFSTFASWWVRHALQRWRGEPHLVHVPEYAKKQVRHSYETLPHDAASADDPAKAAEVRDDLAALQARIAKLPDLDRLVIEARLAGAKFTEIASILGRSRERVRQIEARAHVRLRVLR